MVLRIIYLFNDMLALFYVLIKNQVYRRRKIIANNYPEKKNIIIMGNGPSLKNDINFIKKKRKSSVLYSVNHFPLTSFFLDIKPDFCVFMDSIYWSDNVNDKIKAEKIKLYEILRSVDWPIIIVCPIHGSKYIQNQLKDNLQITIDPVMPSYLNLNSENLSVWALKNRIITPNFVDVSILALWHALHQPSNCIELYGVDGTSFRELEVDQMTNKVFKISSHFYAKNSTNKNTESYPGQQKKKMHQRFYQTWTKFRNLHLLSIVAYHWEKDVKNLSSYSVIDNFDRK